MSNIPNSRELQAAYVSGLTALEIARHYGCPEHHIYVALRANGIERRRRGPRTGKCRNIARINEMLAARRAGHTFGAIGALFGVSRQAAHQIYLKYNAE